MELRTHRASEQLDAMWKDLASERRERQVEMNEARQVDVLVLGRVFMRRRSVVLVSDSFWRHRSAPSSQERMVRMAEIAELRHRAREI